MNKCVMLGRLTKDPEIRVTATGLSVGKYSIAVDRKGKDDKTDFFNCVSFGKQAEFVQKYITKGTKVVVTGRVENESYEKDGQKRTITQIVVEEIEFAESKKADAPKPAPDDFVAIPEGIESDLPFH